MYVLTSRFLLRVFWFYIKRMHDGDTFVHAAVCINQYQGAGHTKNFQFVME